MMQGGGMPSVKEHHEEDLPIVQTAMEQQAAERGAHVTAKAAQETGTSEGVVKTTARTLPEAVAQAKVATTAATCHAPHQAEPRVAFLNEPIRNQELTVSKRYAKNVIVTSKYTTVSFVPKTLFEFFRVTANVYFLVISLLQLLTTWSPTNRFTTAGPLVFVLLVTMIKQGSEDMKRHQADEHQNNRTCRIVNEHGATQTIAWQELQVGQIVCVHNNEELPADIVILATSEEEGRCFIETCNLDGETNLKRRIAVKSTSMVAGRRELNAPVLDEAPVCAAVVTLKGTLEYEQPNNQLYTFTGRLHLQNDGSTTPLGPESIMLRGCGLRSCAFVLGVVIFTGSETKLLQNSRSAPSKQSKLYKTANRCMGLIFVTMFSLCLVSAIAAAAWSHANDHRMWYLPFVKSTDASEFVKDFFTFLILFNNLVPISLYVSLDIIKVMQAKGITSDDDMMCDAGFRAIARTSELNEELGQIEYIFSDKTGTLTCNVMEFRKCSIGGQSYGFGTTEIGRAVAALQPEKGAERASQTTMTEVGVTLSTELNNSSASDVRERTAPIFVNESTTQISQASPEGDPKLAQVHYDPSISFDDPSLLRHLNAGGPRSELIHEFLTLLAICHTVIPEVDKKTGAVTYRASSPDEEALVKAAKCLGYNFVDPAPLTKIEVTRKDMDSGRIEPIVPISQQYTILNVNEFNSSRKRMSIVAVNASTGEYVLYCKGADNMMLSRAVQDEYTASIQQHLRVFAGEGLRTLVLARRVLTREEYDAFNEEYIAASTSLQNREEQLDAVAEMIETNMQILGVTAIEDKLQENVPSTIFDLAQAGIKIWVLTGDREETAINIGHACRLINDRMKLLYVNQESVERLEQQVKELYQAPFIQQLLRTGTVSDEIAMVCDGKALVHVFPSKDALTKMSDDARERANLLAIKLLSVASVCKALIACRVSPSQKAEIVSLVRNRSLSLPSNARKTPPITLAIGDGANDVSMIQTAHVGVGICGKEGVQAVNASDYAISQFKFLKRLVLIHGRFNYKRICKVIRYSFYKNIALVISLFLFDFCNGQSGAPLFESFVMAGWNFFLATPIIVIGVFDQDMPDAIVLKFSKLYRAGQCDSDLNLTVFAGTIANAVFHACICFGVCYGCYNPNHGLFQMGTLFYTMLLATMSWKVMLLTLNWNKYHVLLLGFSVWLFVFFLIVYPLLTFLSFDMFGVPVHMLRDDLFWYLLLMCPIAAILLDFAMLTLQQQFVPTPQDILRERYRMNASMRFSGKADIVPDNMPSLPSCSSSAAKTTSHTKRLGGIDNALVFPTDDIWPQASSLSLLSSQIDMSRNYSTNGFAFNGPDSLSASDTHAEELVTKRVNTFTGNQRIDSTRVSSGIIPKRAASLARQQEDEAANDRSTSAAPAQSRDEAGP